MSVFDNAGAVLSVGRKTVTTAGVPVQLSTTATRIGSVAITAETDNTGLIVVGDSNVVAALAPRKGTPLSPGDTVTLDIAQLTTVYIDSTVDTDGVTFTALAA